LLEYVRLDVQQATDFSALANASRAGARMQRRKST
jgi:hypothetical protein